MNTKHRPSKTILINEKLRPIIIEIGKIDNNIIGKSIFMFSLIFILIRCMLFFFDLWTVFKSSLIILTCSKMFSKNLGLIVSNINIQFFFHYFFK